jgi:hypothetical protein
MTPVQIYRYQYIHGRVSQSGHSHHLLMETFVFQIYRAVSLNRLLPACPVILTICLLKETFVFQIYRTVSIKIYYSGD